MKYTYTDSEIWNFKLGRTERFLRYLVTWFLNFNFRTRTGVWIFVIYAVFYVCFRCSWEEWVLLQLHEIKLWCCSYMNSYPGCAKNNRFFSQSLIFAFNWWNIKNSVSESCRRPFTAVENFIFLRHTMNLAVCASYTHRHFFSL